MFQSTAEDKAKAAGERAIAPIDTHPVLIFDRVTGDYVGDFSANISVIDLTLLDAEQQGIVRLCCQSGRSDVLEEMLSNEKSWIHKGVIV